MFRSSSLYADPHPSHSSRSCYERRSVTVSGPALPANTSPSLHWDIRPPRSICSSSRQGSRNPPTEAAPPAAAAAAGFLRYWRSQESRRTPPTAGALGRATFAPPRPPSWGRRLRRGTGVVVVRVAGATVLAAGKRLSAWTLGVAMRVMVAGRGWCRGAAGGGRGSPRASGTSLMRYVGCSGGGGGGVGGVLSSAMFCFWHWRRHPYSVPEPSGMSGFGYSPGCGWQRRC